MIGVEGAVTGSTNMLSNPEQEVGNDAWNYYSIKAEVFSWRVVNAWNCLPEKEMAADRIEILNGIWIDTSLQ